MNLFQKNKLNFLIVPVLFLLFSAPAALDFVFHYPDEKYYTDAVLQMLDNGDYFTPHKADGSYRFLKPIVTYWVLAASYKIFGVSPFSSRVLFWLAGAALVLVTWLMSKSISKKNTIAFIAAFIVASNPIVLLSSSRSIPDILLTLFLTISAWGFLEIMLSEKIKTRYYWLAYLGAALAFETKGIPAVAFAGISMLFLVLNPWKKVRIKSLIHPVSIIVSILVALSWFIIMYAKHGLMYLDSFYADQVGERVSSKITLALKNGGLGIANVIAFSLPWIIIAFSQPKNARIYLKQLDARQKALFGFIAAWLLLTVLMAAGVFKFYDRYILPVIPLLAVIFASILNETETRFKKGTLILLVVFNSLMLLINTLYSVFIYQDSILIVGIFVAGTALAAFYSGKFKKVSVEILIANGILLFFFSAFSLLYPMIMPNPGKQLVNQLYEKGAGANAEIYVYGNIRTASNLRIQSKNQLSVVGMDTVFQLPEKKDHFLVFRESDKNKLDLTRYEVFTGSEEWTRVPVSKFPEGLQIHIQELKNKRYLIARPILKKEFIGYE